MPEFDGAAFEADAGQRANIGRNEHLVFHVPGAPRVYKITKPGEYGAGGDLAGYLDRIDESNRLVDDDMWLEGALRDSATGRYRLVTSQRWINDARAATPAEIEAYFQKKGFHRYSDRAFYNPMTETLINDAEPVNVLVGRDGIVYPIDIIPTHPQGARLEHIEKVVQARRDAASL